MAVPLNPLLGIRPDCHPGLEDRKDRWKEERGLAYTAAEVANQVRKRVNAVWSTMCLVATEADDIKDSPSLLAWEIDRWGSTIEDHKAVEIAILIGRGERLHPDS